MKKQASLFLWALFFLCPGVNALSPQKYYVKESASGSGSGISWSNASANLQQVVNNASEGDTIFVAQGRYYTLPTDSRGFVMKEGVHVFGGFSGEGMVSNANQMDTVSYKTYLDGNHKTRVLTQDAEFDVNTEWGGFVICNGYLANDNSYGGAVMLRKGGKIHSSTVTGNYIYASETALGGGIYNIGGQVENCIVKNNKILGGGTYGAGIFNQQGSVTNCIVMYNDAEANAFFSNVVAAGGGIYNRDGKIVNTLSARNTVYAYTIVAAYSWGAGIYNSQGEIINCTIADNMSDATADAYTYSAGAGLYNQGNCKIVNSILWNNKVDVAVNNIYNNGTSLYYNSLVEGKSETELGTGQNNLDGTISRLLFKDLFNGDYRLLPYSDAINAGNDSENSTLFDVAGNLRKYGVIDLGAYEYQGEKLNAQVEMTTAKTESGNIRFRVAGVEPGTIIVNFGDGIPVGYEVDNNPLEIIHPVGSAKTISIYTSVYTPYITLFECRNDSLTSLNIADSNISSIDCSQNLLRISTLPEKQSGWTNYVYHPQKEISVKSIVYPTDTIDLSSELERGGIVTSYHWKSKDQTTVLTEGVDYTINQGVTTFLKAQTDSVYCELTNSLFPDLVLKTNKIKVKKMLPVLNIESEQITYTGENIYIQPAYQSNTVNNVPLILTYTYVSGGTSKSYAMDAGEYKVIAHFGGDENHEPVNSNVATLIVKKATPSMILTSKVVPYTGSPIVIDQPILEGSATVKALASSLQYKYGSSSSAPTGVGTYEVTISSVGNANHEAVSKSVMLSITDSQTIVSLSDQYYVYDGTVKTLTPYIADVSQNVSVKYQYEGILANDMAYGPTTEAPVNAGEYRVKATVENIYNTVIVRANLTIKRKEPVFVMQNKTASYTGARISSEIISSEPSGAIYLKTYKGRGDTYYEEDTNAPVNVGTYSVSVVFAGSANYYSVTRKATLSIINKGHSTFVMQNKKAVYSGTAPSIDPLNVLPSDSVRNITYIYSGLDYPSSTTPPINAGNYLVTAAVETDGVIGTQQVQSLLTIEKAVQQIQFDQQQFEDRQLVDQRFDIAATTDSGQPITFSSGNQNIARISSGNNAVVLTGLGVTSIAAQAVSSQNYLAASPVVRTLNVTSSDVTIHELIINGQPHNINQRYVIDCGYTDANINVVIEAGANTKLKFSDDPTDIYLEKVDTTLYIPKAMVKKLDFTVISQDDKTTKDYSLVIERRFNHEDIVKTRTNNMFIAMDALDTRTISSYKWYKKASGGDTFEEVGQGNTYTTPTSASFDPADIYYLQITTSDGEILRSCEFSAVLKSMEIKVYPNPALRNEIAYLEADIDDDVLAEAITDVYSLSGEHVLRFPLTGRTTQLPTFLGSGMYILKVSSKGIYTRSTRFIIK